MIMSINADKALDKIQHPFIIKKKNPQENRNRGELRQLDKEHL